MPNPAPSVQRLRAAFDSAVFTTNDLPAADVGRRRVDQLVGAGLVERVGPGRYRLPGGPRTSRDRHLSELGRLLAIHPHAAAGGVSAAAVRDLRCPDPWGDWLAVPRTLAADRGLTPRAGVRRLRLPESDIEVVDGIRCTTLAATAREVARQLPAPQALITVDHIARKLASTQDKRALIGDKTRACVAASLAADPPRGLQARRTLAWADPAADSAPESFFRAHLLLEDMPPPQVNHPVTGASGRTYWADLMWPELQSIVEIDGKGKYAEEGSLYAEKRREDDLRAAGLAVQRFTAAEIFEHGAAIARSLHRT